MRKTYSGMEKPERPLNASQPALPKRKLALWWLPEDGAQNSRMKMIATPMRCQYTDTSLSRATRWTLNVLSSPWMPRTTTRMRMVAHGFSHVSLPVMMFMNAEMENAQPKLMPAVTATWPSRLNQPVNQDHTGALSPGASLAAQ